MQTPMILDLYVYLRFIRVIISEERFHTNEANHFVMWIVKSLMLRSGDLAVCQLLFSQRLTNTQEIWEKYSSLGHLPPEIVHPCSPVWRFQQLTPSRRRLLSTLSCKARAIVCTPSWRQPPTSGLGGLSTSEPWWFYTISQNYFSFWDIFSLKHQELRIKS